MPGPVRDALKLYLNQTSRRSLRQLTEECAQHGIKASKPTLNRWSVRYSWQRRVAEHDQSVAEKSMASTVDHQVQTVKAYFKLIDSAKSRYYWLIDPNNSSVTPAQRRRATNMTVSDFLRVLKMEMDAVKLFGRLEAKRAAEPERPTTQYTDEEMQVMVQALAHYRHGLPPPRGDQRLL